MQSEKCPPFVHANVLSMVCLVHLFSYLGFTQPAVVGWASFRQVLAKTASALEYG